MRIPVAEYIQKHTLLPFNRGFANTSASDSHGAEHLSHLPRRTIRSYQRLRFCRICAAQECSSLGFSYWHRTHQLPGVLWCPEHRVSLHITPQHQLSPATVTDWAACTESRDDHENVIYRRYLAGVTSLLARRKPADADAAVWRLRVWLQDQGLRHTTNCHAQAFAALQRYAPSGWLEGIKNDHAYKTPLSLDTIRINLCVSVPLLASLAMEEEHIGPFIASCTPLVLPDLGSCTTREMHFARPDAARAANRDSVLGQQSQMFNLSNSR